MPQYFIIFDAIVTGIVFLISLSDSLLVYRNTTSFHGLTLYPTALLNSFISSKFFDGVLRVFSVGYHVICRLIVLLLPL